MSWRTLTRRVEEVWGDTVVNHHRRFLHQRMLVVLAATTLTLAGCTSKGDNKPSPTPSTTSATSSDSSSGSPSAPGTSSPSASISVDIPEAARAHTDAGAIEFAKFAVMTMGKSIATNDDSAFRALTDAACTGCAAISQGIAKQKAAGEHPAEPRTSVEGAQIYGVPLQDRVRVDVLGKDKATNLVNSSGAIVKPLDDEIVRLRLGLLWTDQGWRVGEMIPVNV